MIYFQNFKIITSYKFCFIYFNFFSGYVLIDPVNNILTPQKVFVCLSLLNMLRYPLYLFPMTFKESITMLVSLRRITDFLNADELKTSTTHLANNNNNISIEIKNGSFTWDDPKIPQLKNINLKMKPGTLTAVVGAVGSGKSSLLQGIEIEKKLIFVCFFHE